MGFVPIGVEVRPQVFYIRGQLNTMSSYVYVMRIYI